MYLFIVVQCNAQTCQNGGVCLVQRHQPKCYCPAGFSGQFCEIDIDECASRPCYNGGTCIDLPQRYRCLCPPGKYSSFFFFLFIFTQKCYIPVVIMQYFISEI